jgi:nitroreductase
MATTTAPLDTVTAIQTRRSIKSFKPDPIAPELLQQLLELTVAAPSSFNLQDWRIIVVQDEAQKKALSEAAYGQPQILQAPVTFVFAADSTAWQDDAIMAQIYQSGLDSGAWPSKTVDYFKTAIPQFMEALGTQAREYAVKDAIIAATHTALAAEALGLSTCYMNGWVEDQVKAVIGAADEPEIAIALLLPVGYAAEPRQNPGRLPLSVNVSVDTLGNAYGA